MNNIQEVYRLIVTVEDAMQFEAYLTNRRIQHRHVPWDFGLYPLNMDVYNVSITEEELLMMKLSININVQVWNGYVYNE